MRITLLGHYDLASLYAMNRILKGAPGHAYSVFLSGAQDAAAVPPEWLQRLAAIDRDLSERFLADPHTAPLLRKTRNLPAPNRGDGLAQLRSTEPDLIVSIRYRRILREAAIAIPHHGVLNLHSGILPDYRGVMATFWAMLNGEAEIGSTLHRITDSGIDTGPIIRISRQPLAADASYLANVLSLYQPGCNAVIAAIDEIDQGNEPEALPQGSGAGAYFSTPTEADLARFHHQGKVLAHGAELDSMQAT
jgi:methionyl-tRNA formyltransferase